MTDPDSVSAAVAAVEDALGPLALAVNSAGIANATAAEDMPLAQFQKVLDVNLNGVFLCCQAEGRRMLEHGRGAIVNIASMSGSIVNRDLLQVHYNASKAAVIHLQQVAGDGVGAARHPRQRHHPRLHGHADEHPARGRRAGQALRGRHAAGPDGRPDEMVGPAVFLLSDAASFCTGVDLIVDGGFVCW